MYRNHIKILMFCFLVYCISYSQKDTLESGNDEGVITEIPLEEVPEKKNTDQMQELDSTVSSPVQELSHKKGNFTDFDRLREDAEVLREQAKKLYEKAKDIRNVSDNMDDAIEDLDDEVDDLEDEAQELLKQAGNLQTCIKLSKEADEILYADSLPLGGDTTSLKGNLNEQKMLMLKMRNSADELLIKAKKISVSVREMKESSDEKEDLSDKLEDKAEALEDKAEELEGMAEMLEEEQNQLPFSERFPFRLGHQVRFTAVPPYNDRDINLLLLSGLNFSFYINNFLSVGAEDITLRFSETIYGTRTAISGSPFISFSYFLARRFELGAGIGTAIQGQVGGDKSYDIALAPFIKFFNENWVAKRFSLGPAVKFNFLARGDFFTRSIPFDQAKVLPEKAWWLDFGITYTFHF